MPNYDRSAPNQSEFAMNTTPSQATPPLTTNQEVPPRTIQSTVEIEGSSVRVDARTTRHRGPRAQVLKAYSEWLKQSPTRITTAESSGTPESRIGFQPQSTAPLREGNVVQPAKATPTESSRIQEPLRSPQPPSPSMSPRTDALSRADQEQIDRLFHRIDTAIGASLDQPIVQRTAPHFETRNYVPPAPESISPGSPDPELSERDQDLTTATREPAAGIVEHVRELQSQGRLIGELEIARQLDHARIVRRTVHGKPLPGQPAAASETIATAGADTAEASLTRPSEWPEVTDLLLTRHRVAIDALGQQLDAVLAAGERRVAVTCTRRREGASTIAMALTRWYAETGLRVLLVDADLTHPDLIAKLTPDCTRSWTRALDDPKRLRREITTTATPNVDLLPLFRLGDNTRWKRPILGHLGDALQRFEANYDRVIINTGPVFQLITEIRSADDLADAFVLVTAVNRTTESERQQSQNGLLSVGADKILVAQNFTRR